MKKVMLFSLLFVVLGTVEIFAQDYLAQVRPVGSKEWGYANEKDKMVLKPAYRVCYAFSADGFAVVEQGRQHVLIDTKGKVLETGLKKYYFKEFSLGFGIGATMLSFEDGLVPIRERKGWGFLNTAGKMAVEMKYDNVSGFRDGYAFAVLKNDFFILDKAGKETKVSAAGIREIKRPSEGMVAYRGKDKLMGFIDASTGKVAIKDQYEAVGNFFGGLAWVRTTSDLVGYIDKSGKEVIKPQFETVNNFDPVSGIARVKKDGKWGYVNKEGKMLKLKITTEVYGQFVEGLAKGREGKLFGFFGPDGNWVIKPQFVAVGKVSDGYIAAKKDDLWGFMDLKGNWVIKPKYEGVRPMKKIN